MTGHAAVAWAVDVAVVITVGGILGLCGAHWGRRLPWWTVLLVAVVLRVLVAVLSNGHTPADVRVTIHLDAVDVLHGFDPVTHERRIDWNFLPLMPTLYALLLKLHLSFEAATKLVDTASDVVAIVLLGRIVPSDRRAIAQWSYATNPVMLLVTGVHGQVEPFALAWCLAAITLARRRPAWAGMAIGMAVSAKSWPLLFFPGLLYLTPRRRWFALLTVAVPVTVFLLEDLLVLGDDHHVRLLVQRLLGYRSFIGTWGWTGFLHVYGDFAHTGYLGPHIDQWQRVGTVLLAVGVAATLIALRRLDGVAVSLGLVCVFYVVTAGFGPQYLTWCVPLVLLCPTRAGRWLLAAGGAWAALAYLYVIPFGPRDAEYLLVYGSVLVAVPSALVVAELARRSHRKQRAPTPDAPIARVA